MVDDVLTQMVQTGYGPVTLHEFEAGILAATAAGREVTVVGTSTAIRFQTTASVSWPSSAEVEATVTTSLEELAHVHRPDLVTIEHRSDDELVISMWIPADAAPALIASAVYSTARIATLAADTVNDMSELSRMAERAEVEAQAELIPS